MQSRRVFHTDKWYTTRFGAQNALNHFELTDKFILKLK